MIEQMRDLVEEFLTTFKNVYPAEKIIPKMHFMVHYATVTSKLRPLSQLTTIRFEAHHRYFKELVRVLGNFININKTLALRYQQSKYFDLQEKISK